MKKCLVVIDYQIDFVNGSLGFERAEKIENRLAEKIKFCRQNGYEIVFTFDTHKKDYLSTNEGKHLPVEHCILGSEGHNLFGKVSLQLRKEDRKIFKPSFGSGELYEFLKDNDFDEVELCGVVTDICVLSNAVLAKTALPEARVVVDKTCVASNDPESERAAFTVLKSIQVEIENEV